MSQKLSGKMYPPKTTLEIIGAWEELQGGASKGEGGGKGRVAPVCGSLGLKPQALQWRNAFIVSQSIIGEICHSARKFYNDFLEE